MNKWHWKEIEIYEEHLVDENDNVIARLMYTDYGTVLNGWRCIFYNKECNTKYVNQIYANSIEEARWQATLWIHNECNFIANSYHRIRDHLPSIHELAEAAIKRRDIEGV